MNNFVDAENWNCREIAGRQQGQQGDANDTKRKQNLCQLGMRNEELGMGKINNRGFFPIVAFVKRPDIGELEVG